MHFAMEMREDLDTVGHNSERRSLWEIAKICNIPDRQLLKRFVEEHTFLIHTRPKKVEGKHVSAYYVPRWLRGFFCDPNRSRCFYSTSWIITKCFHTIEEYLGPDRVYHSLVPFFVPTKYREISFASGDIVVPDIAVHGISDATCFLEHVRNGSDRNHLLRFLGKLSEIHWLDIYSESWAHRRLANEIVHWVCTTLVGPFPVTKFY
jgi:hypothetical protein